MIKETPLVSVVIPVYNTRLAYLKDCFESVANQTVPNKEVIVIDDGSTDEVARFCDSFAEEQQGWNVIHTANKGSSAARNKGIDNATGKYFICIDADDIIEPIMLEELVRSAESVSAEVTICRYDTFSDTVNNVVAQEMIESYGMNDIFNISSPSIFKMLFLKSFVKTNDLKFDPGLIRGEDLLFGNQALALAKNIEVIEKVLYHYRENETGIIGAGKPESMTTFLALKKLRTFLEEKGVYSKHKRSYIKLILNGTLLFDYKDSPQLFANNYGEIKKFLLETVGDDSFDKELADSRMVDIMSANTVLEYYHNVAGKLKLDLDYTYKEKVSFARKNEDLSSQLKDASRELDHIRSSYTAIAKVLKAKIRHDAAALYHKRVKK